MHAIDVYIAASWGVHCAPKPRLGPSLVLLGVENHLSAAKHRQRTAGLPMSDDGIPYLRGLAAMHWRRHCDYRTVQSGTEMIGFQLYRSEAGCIGGEIHDAAVS